MKSSIFNFSLKSTDVVLISLLLACIISVIENPVFASSDLEISKIKAEFQKEFIFGENSKNEPRYADIEKMVAPYIDAIKQTPGIVGFAFGIRTLRENKPKLMDYVFKIYLNPDIEEDNEIAKKIPRKIGPYEVVFLEGMAQAAWGGCTGSDFSHYGTLKPGINVGLPNGPGGIGTCGTLGMMVWKNGQSFSSAETERYFLSAWHVLTQNGVVSGPSEISQPGNSYNKPDVVGITDILCGPVCSKFLYEVGLVRIDINRRIVNGYVAQKNPYDPGLPSIPNLLIYQGCGISNHIMNGTQTTGGCVAGYYRDFCFYVNVQFGTNTVRMENQMVIEALYPTDIITNDGDSGMIWTDGDGYPIAITMAKGIYNEPFNFNRPYNCAISSWLLQVFNELGLTAIKPQAPVIVTPGPCPIFRALDNSREQELLETKIAPLLHNSSLEPFYGEFRVGGKYYRELYNLTFSDSELRDLLNELSKYLVSAYNNLMEDGYSGLVIDKRAVEIFREYVKKVTPKMSLEAKEYMFELLDLVEVLSKLDREKIMREYIIEATEE